ncbi:hypothetical protein [Methylomagnum ishizawai]|uniref:hypothetical protein n=1 Tax=Methylomagnum ishizawai TaxID=1760988 RepID=UPI000F74BC64|nr:hypothetical protein [Methylomagnum ishizawai]
MIISALIAFLALLLVVANIMVTIATARSELFEPLQKKASIWFIWFFPVVGVGLLWYILHEDMGSRARSGDSGNRYIEDDYLDGHESQ